jgi:ABC-type transport system substrate-binding protein
MKNILEEVGFMAERHPAYDTEGMFDALIRWNWTWWFRMVRSLPSRSSRHWIEGKSTSALAGGLLRPKTGAFIPRLAEKWQANADLTEWTFLLRKGVPFHFGYGEFTAKDVAHSHALMTRQDATATLANFCAPWKRSKSLMTTR